jgi:hypothetical protein
MGKWRYSSSILNLGKLDEVSGGLHGPSTDCIGGGERNISLLTRM